MSIIEVQKKCWEKGHRFASITIRSYAKKKNLPKLGGHMYDCPEWFVDWLIKNVKDNYNRLDNN